MRRINQRVRKGNFLVMFAASITVVLGFGALAIDLSYLRNSRMELRNAVDAASHAAMIEYRRSASEGLARAVAKQVAAENKVAGHTLTLQDADVTFGVWDFDTSSFGTSGGFINAVQVVATRDADATDGPIQFFLAPVLGIDSGAATADATSAFRFREMMLILDTTGSFRKDIDNGRDAIIGFLDRVYLNHLPQDTIGLITFAQEANLFSSLQSLEVNYATLRASWYGDGDRTNRNCPSPCTYRGAATGLGICFKDQDGDGVANSTIPVYERPVFSQRYVDASGTENLNCYDGSYFPAPDRQEGTDHSVGLEAAIDHLEDYGLPGNLKVIVMVTDGKVQCKQPDDATSAACVTARTEQAYAQAQRAAEAGMSTFVVMYCSTTDCNDPIVRARYEAYSEALVTGTGRAYFTNVGTELDDILAQIADSLPIVIVE